MTADYQKSMYANFSLHFLRVMLMNLAGFHVNFTAGIT